MLSKLNREKIIIMIPALNPPKDIILYIDELIQNDFKNIIVINDGSSKEYDYIFNQINRKCIVINHKKNYGKGKAIKSGLEFICNNEKYKDCIGVITVDSDGQHLIKDVIKISESLNENPNSLILGVRDFNSNNVPSKSKFGNKATSYIFKLLYNVKISDTQTGLRAIPTKLYDRFKKVPGDRFEYETNMLIDCICNKISIIEIKIETVYLNNNSETHFRPIHDSIAIYLRIFNSFIKYSFVSIVSCVIDLTFFQVFLLLLQFNKSKQIILATVFARIISSLINYLLNKKFTFKSQSDVVSTILK